MKPSITVIVPAHDEAGAIGSVLQDLEAVLRENGGDWEVLVVDDGSTDGTAAAARKALAQVRVIEHATRLGNGSCVRSGLEAARFPFVAIVDADGQHPPALLSAMIRELPDGDLVVAARRFGGAGDRDVANRLLSGWASFFAGVRIPDLTCGFRLFRRDLMVTFVPLIPKGFSFPTTSTLAFLRAGHRVRFVPMGDHRRVLGRSKMDFWRDGARMIWIAVKILVITFKLRSYPRPPS